MVSEVLIAVIAVVILFEVFEHVIIPVAAMCTGRRRQPLTGAEGMVGKVVEVRRWSGRHGTVTVDGELWHATSRATLAVGAAAVVRAVSNLTLDVDPVAQPEASDESSGPRPFR